MPKVWRRSCIGGLLHQSEQLGWQRPAKSSGVLGNDFVLCFILLNLLCIWTFPAQIEFSAYMKGIICGKKQRNGYILKRILFPNFLPNHDLVCKKNIGSAKKWRTVQASWKATLLLWTEDLSAKSHPQDKWNNFRRESSPSSRRIEFSPWS